MAGTFVVYVGLLFLASREPDLELDDPNAPLVELPHLVPTLLTGMHFLLPIFVLVWCLLVEFLSPGLPASWATVSLRFIVLTHRPLPASFRGVLHLAAAAPCGLVDMVKIFILCPRNFLLLALATSPACIIIGSRSHT